MLSKEKLLPEPIKGLKENPFLDSYVIEFLDLPSSFKEPDLRKGKAMNGVPGGIWTIYCISVPGSLS